MLIHLFNQWCHNSKVDYHNNKLNFSKIHLIENLFSVKIVIVLYHAIHAFHLLLRAWTLIQVVQVGLLPTIVTFILFTLCVKEVVTFVKIKIFFFNLTSLSMF